MEKACTETIAWLDTNANASVEEFEAKKKEVEGVCNPIMQKMYQSGDGGAAGDGDKHMGGAEEKAGATVDEVD